jgi:antibiotic biosynthesis monooxygenase (ABM) superfamily enzyme
VENREWLQLCSKWLTSYRQYNEHGNGGLKRAFIRISEPVLVRDIPRFKQDFITCMQLYNLRSRVLGFNQVRTAVLGESDKNFRDMLSVGGKPDAYLAHCDQRLRDLMNGEY